MRRGLAFGVAASEPGAPPLRRSGRRRRRPQGRRGALHPFRPRTAATSCIAACGWTRRRLLFIPTGYHRLLEYGVSSHTGERAEP